MNWININVSVIDSEEFLGAEPTQRATWLCLLRYCCGQENGGRIVGARLWKDRKWQQVVRVTGREVADACDLWAWDGDDLVVVFYPQEKEDEVKRMRSLGSAASEAKRAAAKANGSKGGRPPKNPTPTEQETQQESEQNGELETELETELKTHEKPIERKGKEGNRIEEEEHRHPRPPKFDEVKTFADSAPMPVPDECVAAFFDEMESVQWTYRGLPCVERTAWHARFRRFITNWNNNERGRDRR